MSIHGHGSLDGFSIGHVKLLEHILDVLGLTNERDILELLDLKSEEEGQLAIMDISNLFVIILLKSSHQV